MKLELFDSRVVVKVEKIEAHGIIIIPNSKEERAGLVGEVIEIGPDCERVKPGDKVLYARHSGFFLPFPRDERYEGCKLMNEDEILGLVIEED